MTVDERLEKFKGFFLKPESDVVIEGLSELRQRLDLMDAENFDCIYQSMNEDEKAAIDSDITVVDAAYLVRDLIHNKALHRYWDAIDGRTDFDNDSQQLILSKDSSLLELGVSYNVFVKTRSVGLYSIGQFIASLDVKGLYTEEELSSITLSLKWFDEDGTARLEGVDALPSF